MSKKKYTEEHIDFIRNNITGTPIRTFVKMFNEHFATAFSFTSITSIIYRSGHKNGNDGNIKKGERRGIATEFKKGNIPYNKGKKGVSHPNQIPTQFKHGNTPHNTVPVGTEVITADGYTKVKVGEPNKWRFKHRILWESLHGEIPNGHALLFLDGNKQNIIIENLALVSRKELAILNKKHMLSKNPDLTKTAINLVKLMHKANDLKKR